ncbi:transcription initiation factor TFIID subunit 4-like [Schistocerca gregaria]|uniref:transcription initiation factor TFIID subunit 4-like n=1 Tax=Schistocerca gregaria TaxID=7010 RepID=UPI00211E0949|nr:transcription initiation factor TFIID subunit 4-like [Schistocerca gregaria]
MSSPCYRGPPRPGNAAAPQPPVSAAAATAVRSSPTELRDGTTRIPARCGGTYSLACARVSVSPVGGSHAANDAPPRGGAPNNEADCCCGVAQLLHSRIPTATDTAAINRRAGIFSRINSSEAARAQPVSDLQPRVYRSTFEWSRLGEAGAVAVATAPAPAAPSARRVAVRTKPQLPASLRPPATCTSAHAALDVADDEQPRPGAARRNALDRLQRFRLERSGRRSPAPSTPASATTAAGSAHAQNPSAAPPPAPPPHRKKPRTKHAKAATAAPSTLKQLPVPVTAEEKPAASSPEDDIFNCVNLRLPKPEPRTIVGSYIQRSIPIRSASFSQVDFSPSDGKYIRCVARASPYASPAAAPPPAAVPPPTAAGGSLTLPRKRAPAADLAVPSTEEQVAGGSTPSVDSAVGSDEGLVAPTSTISCGKPPDGTASSEASHKPSGARSLTYPLPRRGSRSDDDIPFTSIDGNGLKSLLCTPLSSCAVRELPEVAEESETSLTDSGVAANVSELGDKQHPDTPPAPDTSAPTADADADAACHQSIGTEPSVTDEHRELPDASGDVQMLRGRFR